MRHRTKIVGLALACVILAASVSAAEKGPREVRFSTSGGIQATADLYASEGASSLILLFHQAGWSRGEYREIAPKLTALGYRVMAVDQRSGKGIGGVVNETAKRATKKGLGTDYLDAYPDLEAALAYAHESLDASRVIVWGSSYSASLVLRLAAEHPERVSAVLAFSPGEYFKAQRGPSYVEGLAKRVKQPLFVTSSKRERPQVEPIFDASPSKKKILFTPASTGQHGSRALWEKWPDHDVYWAAVKGFLGEYAPPKTSD